MMTNGERWIQLLRSYSPVADNEAMQAEHIDKLARHLGVAKLSFIHPAKDELLSCFPLDTGQFKNVVLTGTAGDGKTSLCLGILDELKHESRVEGKGIATISIQTEGGIRNLTLIYDVTAWRKSNVILQPEQVEVISRMAKSVYDGLDEYFVLAVNDGQMHELFRALPPGVDPAILQLQNDLITTHANGGRDCSQRLSLLNLSHVRSERIMKLCLGAILDRAEWSCFKEEPDHPLFNPQSSLARNFTALSAVEIQEKLLMLAQLADVTGHHLPVRGVLCLLTNALLGHPDAKDGVLRPGTDLSFIGKHSAQNKAAFHRNLFGDNLKSSVRNKRGIYRFLSMIHIGEETTNDLDELIIFGEKDVELAKGYAEIVASDRFGQHNPHFGNLLTEYIRGEIIQDEETKEFLSELAAERRRIFLQASVEQMDSYELWQTTIFHHAGTYLREIISPLNNGKNPGRAHLRKITSGLNRIWTGLLLTEDGTELYFTSGLDLTAAPISDLFLAQADLESTPPAVEIAHNHLHTIPDLILNANGNKFKFPLTLQRFEFLCRVSEGTMPSSFSREASSDFMSLKQRCLRDLGLKASTTSLNLLEVREAGTIHKRAIHFSE